MQGLEQYIGWYNWGEYEEWLDTTPKEPIRIINGHNTRTIGNVVWCNFRQDDAI